MTLRKFKFFAWSVFVGCGVVTAISLWKNDLQNAASFGLVAAVQAFFLIDPATRKRRDHVR